LFILYLTNTEKENMNLEKVFLFLYGKVYPFIGFPLMAWLWYQKYGVAFSALVMGLPLLFGYIVPGIGTNVLKMWRFRDSWVIGDYYIHHGFIYASGMSLALYICFFPNQDGSVWAVLGNLVRTAALIGFVGWWHDLIAIRQGVLEIHNRPWREGAAPEVIVTQYAPLCFSLIGTAYTGVAVWGYEALVRQGNMNALWWLIPVGLGLMALATLSPLLTDPYTA
jgi:hypothetical protein